MEPERAVSILTDKRLILAIFQYRVSRMVQDTVRSDPDRSFEATLLSHRQRMEAADNLAYALLALLDAPEMPIVPPVPGEGEAS